MKLDPKAKALKALFRRNRANALVELEEAKLQVRGVRFELEAIEMEERLLESPADQSRDSVPAGRLASGSLDRRRKREKLRVLKEKKAKILNRLGAADERLSKAVDSVAESQNALKSLERREKG